MREKHYKVNFIAKGKKHWMVVGGADILVFKKKKFAEFVAQLLNEIVTKDK